MHFLNFIFIFSECLGNGQNRSSKSREADKTWRSAYSSSRSSFILTRYSYFSSCRPICWVSIVFDRFIIFNSVIRLLNWNGIRVLDYIYTLLSNFSQSSPNLLSNFSQSSTKLLLIFSQSATQLLPICYPTSPNPQWKIIKYF